MGRTIEHLAARADPAARLARLLAAGTALLAAAVLVLSQARYPANLAFADCAASYLVLVVVLAALAVALVTGAAASPPPVASGCAALLPGWCCPAGVPSSSWSWSRHVRGACRPGWASWIATT